MQRFDWRAAALAVVAVAGALTAIAVGGLAFIFGVTWIAEHTPAVVGDIGQVVGQVAAVLFGVLLLWGLWAKFYDRFERRTLNPQDGKDSGQ